jgi:hypothetical protein
MGFIGSLKPSKNSQQDAFAPIGNTRNQSAQRFSCFMTK